MNASYWARTASVSHACPTRAVGERSRDSRPTKTDANSSTSSSRSTVRASGSRSRAATQVPSWTEPKPRNRRCEASRERATRRDSGIACHTTVQTSLDGVVRPKL